MAQAAEGLRARPSVGACSEQARARSAGHCYVAAVTLALQRAREQRRGVLAQRVSGARASSMFSSACAARECKCTLHAGAVASAVAAAALKRRNASGTGGALASNVLRWLVL
jgi:hypothetical protein